MLKITWLCAVSCLPKHTYACSSCLFSTNYNHPVHAWHSYWCFMHSYNWICKFQCWCTANWEAAKFNSESLQIHPLELYPWFQFAVHLSDEWQIMGKVIFVYFLLHFAVVVFFSRALQLSIMGGWWLLVATWQCTQHYSLLKSWILWIRNGMLQCQYHWLAWKMLLWAIHAISWVATLATLANPLPWLPAWYTACPSYVSQLHSQDSREHNQIWREIPGLPTLWSAPVSISGSLLAVNGEHKDTRSETAIHLYQPNTGKWVKVGDSPTAWSHCTCVVLADSPKCWLCWWRAIAQSGNISSYNGLAFYSLLLRGPLIFIIISHGKLSTIKV